MSDDWAVRSGIASDWEDPNPQKGKCKVGGRAVWVFRFKKDSEEVSPEYEALKRAAINNQWVKCEGPEYHGTMQSGKSYVSFTAYRLSMTQTDADAPAATPAPAQESRQDLIMAQWAFGQAVSLSTSERADGVPASFKSLPLEEKASYLLAAARDLADGGTKREYQPGDREVPPEVKEAF